MISTVIFDFGGVLAEEGFRNGLLRIATKWKYDAKWFRHTAVEMIYSCGYVNGLCKEEIFWKLLKQNTGHCLGDSILREFLIGGFVLRPKVIQFVKRIRDLGFIVLGYIQWVHSQEASLNFIAQLKQLPRTLPLIFANKDSSPHAQALKDDLRRSGFLVFDDMTLCIQALSAVLRDNDHPTPKEESERPGIAYKQIGKPVPSEAEVAGIPVGFEDARVVGWPGFGPGLVFVGSDGFALPAAASSLEVANWACLLLVPDMDRSAFCLPGDPDGRVGR